MAKKMEKSNNNSLANEYIKAFENEYNLALEQNSREFIDSFFNYHGFSSSKELFYDAFYLLKKGFYPRMYIYFRLYIAFKKVFKKHNIQQLQGYESFFAKQTLYGAISAYCKNKPFEDGNAQYYQPESFFKKIKRKIRQFFIKKTKWY